MAAANLHSQQSTFDPLFIAGPTASGKTAVSIILAKRLDGEIISVDSMQVYRGLNIGTAKPTARECAQTPHHLIDVAELSERFDAARFVELAKGAMDEIRDRGRTPIFCGGTGLYFKAFLEGLGDAPPADPRLRTQLAATPLADLLAELERRDPAAFATMDRKNPRRVIRAVEVVRLTGKPFSEQRADWTGPTHPPRSERTSAAAAEAGNPQACPSPALILGLSRAPDDLRRRIDARVDAMFARGLVAETETLLSRGLEQSRTAMQAIGYRQVVEHLRGERALDETIERVKVRTRQYAKRQMTWFRHQLPVQWTEVEPGDSAATVADRIIEMAAGATRH